MLSALFTVLSTLAISTAAPLTLAPRAGPSGQVITPAGGTVIDQQADVLYFKYQPVTESTNPGYATQYVNLYIWDQDTDVTTALALGLSSPDETEDAITGGYISANFSFAAGGFCGNSLQLVVDEYQTGADAPLNGFQSAAPFFSIINCYTINPPTLENDGGHLVSPTEGSTIGAHRDSVLVSYQAEQGEQYEPYSVHIDVQDDSYDVNDENAWTTVLHYLYTPYSTPGEAWFSALHWGYDGIGGKRLRVVPYGLFVDVWFTSITYYNITVTDTY